MNINVRKGIKILLVFVFLFNIYNIFSKEFKIEDLADDTVLAKVGNQKITMFDFKLFVNSIKALEVINNEIFMQILTNMIYDALYYNYNNDTYNLVSDINLDVATLHYLWANGVDMNNKEDLKAFFSKNELYSSIEDFRTKYFFVLNKIKYFASKGLIPEFKSKVLYLPFSKYSNKDVMTISSKITNATLPFEYYLTTYDHFETKDTIDIRKNKTLERELGKKEIDKLYKIGLLDPVTVKGKTGFFIIMHYDNVMPDIKTITKELSELQKRYKVEMYINVANKKGK